MTDARTASRRSRRPGPAAVALGSLALFAVLFALFTYQLSAASESGRDVVVRKVVERRVVTTVASGEGEASEGELEAGEAEASAASTPTVTSTPSSGGEPLTTSAS